ncbi:hypothetical protein BC829DRAFT_416822 [Chytridium lagenaria]|nr:hypothetical protein BC829DRAFT_416822 [Chytridium lagenaria]
MLFHSGAIVVAPSRMLNLWRLTVYLSVMGSERKRQASVSKQEASESLSSIVIPERAMKLGKELQRVYQPLLIMDDEETKRSLPESVHKAALVSEPKWLALILILNGQCFFQWPITVAMWGWATDYKSRPGFMVFAFLPISFLCSTWGGVWLGILSGRVTKAQKALVDAEEAASSDGTQEVAVGQVKVETRPKAATLDSNSTMTEIAVESMEDVAPTSVPLPPAANPSVCINADAVAQQTADRLDLNTQHDEVKP